MNKRRKKNEETKEVWNRGTLLNNTQIIIRERKRQWSKIRVKVNAKRIIRRKSHKNQSATNAAELTLGNVEQISEHVSNVERKDTSLGTARKMVRNKKRLMLEYSHSPRWMQKETPQ